MKKIVFLILCTLFFLSVGVATAEVKIPYEFKSGEVARASDVNANFNALKKAIEQLQKRTAELETKNSDLEQENRILKESIAELKQNITELKNALETKISSSETISPKESTLVPSGTSVRVIKLRSEPLAVSEDEFRNVFKLSKNSQPLEYIENDFEEQGDVVVDRATGLMWQKSGSDEPLTYKATQTYIEDLNRQRFAGYDDWRLPTVEELMSLLEPERQPNELYIDPIFDATQLWCWSADERSSGSAWYVGFHYGYVRWYYVRNLSYVRVVRS
jgi:cell division protein FtsB